MTQVAINESKERILKYEELWGKFRVSISSITENSDVYDKK